MTSPECSLDEKRGCTLCRCGSAGVDPPPGMVNSESIPPVH
jgi:hypothetical protein